jgi:hypothetical protein
MEQWLCMHDRGTQFICHLNLQVKDSLHSDDEENTLDVVHLQISEMANNNLCTFPVTPYLLKISF